MISIKRYLLACGFLMVSQTMNAQAHDTVKKWSLGDCISYASKYNIQVNTSRLGELFAQQDLRAAKGNRLPDLSATIGNTFHNANQKVADDGGLVNQLTSSGSYSLNSSIVLWNDNYINNTIEQKSLLAQVASLSVKQSLNDITLLIVASYLDILLAKENLVYVSDLVGASQARVKQGELFFEAGAIARKDLLQLQAQLASDNYLLVQTQNAIRQHVLALKQVLQLPADTLFDVAIPVSVTVQQALVPLPYVRQAALDNFPEIQIGKLGVDIASLDIARARAGFKPVLTANGAVGTGYSDVITNRVVAKTGYFRQTGNNFYQHAGVSLFIPIFSNWINKTNLEKARIAYAEARLGLQNNQLILSQVVEQAYLDASNSIQSYLAANEQLNAAAETFRIAGEQFNLGAINTYDLLQQRNQYLQAVQAYTQAKYSAILQQKIYSFYSGVPVTL